MIIVLVKMIVMKKSHALTCPNVNVTAGMCIDINYHFYYLLFPTV